MNGETNGPYVVVATLCEKVLQENDGVLSAIRIVDRIVLTASGPGAPQQMPPMPVNLALLIVLKSGEAKGSYTVKIRPVAPRGRTMEEISVPVLLEGEDRGANLILNMGFPVGGEGLYWFDVFVNEELVTRIPLRIVYQRIAVGGSGGQIH